MIPTRECMQRPLRKTGIEVQAKAAFESLSVSYYPVSHGGMLQSLAPDDILGNLLFEVCMRFVNVIPNIQSKETLMCEMWMIKGPTHDPIPVWGHQEEWEEVKKACWHATEYYCAQMAQDNHEHNLWQLVVCKKRPYQKNVL